MVPRALDEILQHLTHKDPANRYHSADAALADLVALQDALRRGVGEPEVTVGSRDCTRTVTELATIGRENELSTLLGALTDAGAGTSGVVIVEAESGGGQSRVLEELGRRAILSLRAVVEDDGVGFDIGGSSAIRLGLRGMTERAELVGGVLRVTSAPGEGAAIVFEVSLV
jgi:two-component system sensor kinase